MPGESHVSTRRRLAFAGVAYAFAMVMLGTTLPTPLYVFYRQAFGFSELMITVIFTTYAAGVIAGLLLFGRLSDDIGRRRVLIPGVILSILSAVCFLGAHGLALLLVGRLLSGLSAGIFTGTATATLVDLVPDSEPGRATLVATMVNMGGLGLGPLLSGFLAQWAGLHLRLAFWVDLTLLVPALLAVSLAPDPPADERRLRLRPQAISVPGELRAAFARAAVAGFAGSAVLGMFTAVSPAFLATLLHESSHALLGLVVFSVFVASTVGQLALARIPEEAALPVGCAVLVLGAVLMALSLAATSLALLVAGGLVAGFGQGLSFRAGLAALSGRAPASRRGEVASSFFVVVYVAISIPVIGVGVLTQATSLRTAGLVFTIGIALLAAAGLAAVSAARLKQAVA